MQITNHARKRFVQRGFTEDLIEQILSYGEVIPCPGNTIEVRITNNHAKEIIKTKKKQSKEIRKEIKVVSKCRNKAILLNGNGEVIITAYEKNSNIIPKTI